MNLTEIINLPDYERNLLAQDLGWDGISAWCFVCSENVLDIHDSFECALETIDSLRKEVK